mgnify:CR=1 FL=1
MIKNAQIFIIFNIYVGWSLPEDFNPFTPAPIDGDEAQYAVEFGWMMAREGMKPKEKEFDAYLQGILFESGSKLTLKDLM